jgi:hypothetical protein
MTAVLTLIAAVYGASLVIVAGGSVLYRMSPSFRQQLLDQSQPR